MKNVKVKRTINPPHRKTSIGKSFNTKPKNKRVTYKKYRGQGK